MKNGIIQIIVRPEDFKTYNERLPETQGELDSYTEKVAIFIEQSIAAENRCMCSAITRHHGE